MMFQNIPTLLSAIIALLIMNGADYLFINISTEAIAAPSPPVSAIKIAPLKRSLIKEESSKPMNSLDASFIAATPTFTNISKSAGIQTNQAALLSAFGEAKTSSSYSSTSAAWGDYNNDSWVDLYVTNDVTGSQLFLNNLDGTFSLSPYNEELTLSDVDSNGATWVDYDNDGWRDLYIVNRHRNRLFRNDDGRGFTDVSTRSRIDDNANSMAAAWGDYDQDGYLDLYIANATCYPACDPIQHRQARDKLFRNNGNGTFRDMSYLLSAKATYGSGHAVSFLDFDNDGDLDIYVVNDATYNPIGNVLWRNDGRGCDGWCWRNIAGAINAGQTMASRGLGVTDYNFDGDLDLIVLSDAMLEGPLSVTEQQPLFLDNLANGTFTTTLPLSVTNLFDDVLDNQNNVVRGTPLVDLNNDQRVDFLTTAQLDLGDSVDDSRVAADPRRERVFATVAYADYDQDGWMDFITDEGGHGAQLFRNLGQDKPLNRWLNLKLVGDGNHVNRDAVGTRVYLTTTSRANMLKDVRIDTGMGASHDNTLHFGLGNETIQSLLIIWPDGKQMLLSADLFDFQDTSFTWKITYPVDLLEESGGEVISASKEDEELEQNRLEESILNKASETGSEPPVGVR